ncbi:MAG: DUF7107 domain-containing protein [Patescibacteria group bacterium]
MKHLFLALVVLSLFSNCDEEDFAPGVTIPCEWDMDCPSDSYCDQYYFCVWPEEYIVVEGQPQPQTEVIEEVVYVDCVDDWDCDVGEYCYRDFCYRDAECLDDLDCGAYEDCEGGECVAVVECLRDEHCYSDEYCGQDGFCYQNADQCQNSYDCPENTVCERGRCVVPYATYACWTNLDCPPGFNVCVDIVCPTEEECPGICAP